MPTGASGFIIAALSHRRPFGLDCAQPAASRHASMRMVLSGDHRLRDALDLLALRAGGHRHLARVQAHVPPLDALGGQRADGRQVLRQADADDDLGQLAGSA